MLRAVITYGANLSHAGKLPETTVQNALSILGDNKDVDVRASSRVYRSPAFPVESEAPDFVNGAVLLETSLQPDALLAILHGIEERMGRVRSRRWGPRTLDLDLIAVEDLVFPDRATQERWAGLDPDEAGSRWPETLILPHPRMAERPFVLMPMADVWPDWRHPVSGLSVTEMLDRLDPAERDAVRPL